MYIIPFEISACIISLIALIYGIISIIKFEMPMYFKISVAACGCYVLEELWVVVNTLFGNYGSFITVRLFGVFGFFCFLLCANTGGLDKLIDEGGKTTQKIRAVSLIAPTFLFIMFLLFSVINFKTSGIFKILISFIVLAPTFPASYYNLKHLLLKSDGLGFLGCIKWCDIISLAIYIFNCIYLIRFPRQLIILSYISDIIMALLVFWLVIMSINGGKKWKTFL